MIEEENVSNLTLAGLGERVGQELGVSDWVTIDQARIDTFASCTGDHQWIHVDVERAKRESPFRGSDRPRLSDARDGGAAGDADRRHPE